MKRHEFDIDMYAGKYLMVCDTREESEDFSVFLDQHGRKWASGRSYLDERHISCETLDGCVFAFNEGLYSSNGFSKLKPDGYNVLFWRDYVEYYETNIKYEDIIA